MTLTEFLLGFFKEFFIKITFIYLKYFSLLPRTKIKIKQKMLKTKNKKLPKSHLKDISLTN